MNLDETLQQLPEDAWSELELILDGPDDLLLASKKLARILDFDVETVMTWVILSRRASRLLSAH